MTPSRHDKRKRLPGVLLRRFRRAAIRGGCAANLIENSLHFSPHRWHRFRDHLSLEPRTARLQILSSDRRPAWSTYSSFAHGARRRIHFSACSASAAVSYYAPPDLPRHRPGGRSGDRHQSHRRPRCPARSAIGGAERSISPWPSCCLQAELSALPSVSGCLRRRARSASSISPSVFPTCSS